MNVAIDIDGTASAYPVQIAALSAALKSAGHSVVLLTGHSHEQPDLADRLSLLAGRRAQVAPWGLSFDDIFVCVGRNSTEVADLKASYCRSHNVALFIDDSRNYCCAVKRFSPSTLVLEVFK